MSKEQLDSFGESLVVPPPVDAGSKLKLSLELPLSNQPQRSFSAPPFNELAKQLDPMMSAADYDAIREKYFKDHVLPALPPMEIASGWKKFKEGTERQPLQTPAQHLATQFHIATNEAFGAMWAPLTGVSDSVAAIHQKVAQETQGLNQIAAREGISSTVPKFIGNIVGALPPILLAEGAIGPAVASVLQEANTSARTIELMNRVLKGGMAFATYEAASDQTGHRVMAGLRGFAWGAAPPLAVGLPGFLKAAAPEVASTVDASKAVAGGLMEGKALPKDVNDKAASAIEAQTNTARKEGRPNVFLNFEAKPRGTYVLMKTPEGVPTNIEVKPDGMQDAIKRISQILDGGGSLETIQSHSTDSATGIEVVQQVAKTRGYGYNDSLVVQAQQRVLVEAEVRAQASAKEALAKAGRQKGIPTSFDTNLPLWDETTSEADAQKAIARYTNQYAENQRRSGNLAPTARKQEIAASLMKRFTSMRTGSVVEGNAEVASKLAEGGIPSEVKGNRLTVPTVNVDVKPTPLVKDLQGKPLFGMNTTIEDASKIIDDHIGQLKASPAYSNASKDTFGKIRASLWKSYNDNILPFQAELMETEQTARALAESGEAPKMTMVQARELATKLGKDPEESDLLAIMHMGEDEINRLMETVEKQKMTGITAANSETEEAARLGKIEGKKSLLTDWAFGKATTKRVDPNAPSLLKLLGFDPEEHSLMDAHLEKGDGHVKIVVPNSTLSWLKDNTSLGEFEGLTTNSWQKALREIGVPEGEVSKLDFPNSPLIILREGATESTIWHEEMHSNLVNAETNPMLHVNREHRGTLTSIINGLSEKGYDRESFNSLVDEAYTYSSQAVRFNNDHMMDVLAHWDTSREHVLQMVHDTSENLLEASYSKLDSPGVRNFQVKLKDLIRRAGNTPFADANEALGDRGLMLGYEPNSGGWIIPMGDGNLRAFQTLNEAWDHILATDISHYTSDPTYSFQARGVRGPFTMGPPPGKRLPQPDFPLDKNSKGIGWTAVNGWFRPFLSWAATLDRQANKVWAAKGSALPIFEKVKGVDDAIRAGETFLEKWTGNFAENLKHFDHKQQVSLFELLAQKEGMWDDVAAKFRFTPEEVGYARKLQESIKAFQEETKIQVIPYLQDFYTRLKASDWKVDSVPGWTQDPKSAGFWNKAVLEGRLNPSDNHTGRFLRWLINEGWGKQYTNKPLRELQRLVDTKGKTGTYVLGPARYPLTNYINSVKGVPDVSSKAINAAVGNFSNFLGAQFKRMNQYLPEGMKLPEELGTPQNLVNRMILFSYAGGLAARPAIMVRDIMQVFITGLPSIGPASFAKGLGRAMTREGWTFAENAGALLRKSTIGELYGDIFNDLPLSEKGIMSKAQSLAQKTLGLSRWGNNLARTIVFHGAYADALDAVDQFAKGTINQDAFLKASHAWNLEPQLYSKYIARASEKGFHDVEGLAREMALEVTDQSQWAYRKGTAPAMLKTGAGRIMGQYGTWPLNYAEFATGMLTRYSRFPVESSRTMAMWVAANAAASLAMEGIGADSSKWLWTSPASYTGGPQLDLVRDIAAGLGSDKEAESARARVLRYPLNFIPGNIAARSVITALEKHEDMSFGGKGFIRAMGFKPLDEINKDQDYLEWALEESGVTASPYRR